MGKVSEATIYPQGINIWRATLTLGLAALLTRATTFITQVVVANRFGASYEADAYFVAENILWVSSDFIAIGFSVSFIPLWMEYLSRHSEKQAHAFANAMISIITIAAVVLAAVLALTAPLIIRLIAPGFLGPAQEAAILLLMVMAPSLAFLGLTAGCTGLLEAHRRFVLPELSYMAYNLTILIAAISMSGRWGVMSLAWGTLAAAFVRLIVQLPNALRLGIIHLTHRVNHEGVRRAGRLILPIFLAYSGVRVTMLLGSLVASMLSEGAVAELAYAYRVVL